LNGQTISVCDQPPKPT